MKLGKFFLINCNQTVQISYNFLMLQNVFLSRIYCIPTSLVIFTFTMWHGKKNPSQLACYDSAHGKVNLQEIWVEGASTSNKQHQKWSHKILNHWWFASFTKKFCFSQD